MASKKPVEGPTDPNTKSVVNELQAEGAVTQAGQPVAPGFVRHLRNHKFPFGRVKNPKTSFKELPKRSEVVDPETNKPKRGVRFKTVRGNEMVKF